MKIEQRVNLFPHQYIYTLTHHISQQFAPTSFATSSTANSRINSSSVSNIISNAPQMIMNTNTPSEITGPPSYAYFTWNSQALSVHPAAVSSRLQEKEQSDLEVEIQKDLRQRASFASTPTLVPSPGNKGTHFSAGSPSTSVFVAVSDAPHAQLAAQTAMESQVPGKALPSAVLHQRLEGQLEVRHANLLAHINTRYTNVVEGDCRRRAAYQEAAFQRAMEIDAEDRWRKELSNLFGLTSPISSTPPTSASSASHAQYSYSPPLVEIQRNRTYLQLLINNTDMHISALRDAHRVAYEREVIEAQLATRVLRELELRRDTLAVRRAQEARCAVGEPPAPQLASSLAKMKCTKPDCSGCAKNGCVSDALAPVHVRVGGGLTR